jgi:glutathione S-transferase
MRLITIPLSHYCERARWALDHCDLPYREEQHLQMFHLREVRRAGGRRTVPVLETPEGPLTDSADIVAYAGANAPPERVLYPDRSEERAEVEALERDFAHELGVEVRRWAYLRLLPHRRLLLRYNAGRAPALERFALRLAYPFARRKVSEHLGVTPEKVESGAAVIARHLDAVAGKLSGGRRFLVGDRFGAADLTFGAMAALLVMPPEYGVPLPALDELPTELAADVDRFRAHPAGAFALRLYREHRRAPSRPSARSSEPARDGLRPS